MSTHVHPNSIITQASTRGGYQDTQTILNKASSSAGVWQDNCAGTYQKGMGAGIEAVSAPLFTPSGGVAGGCGAYKDTIAKSYKQSCKARFCQWARCARAGHEFCASFLWATAEYQRLKTGFLIKVDDGAVHKKQKALSERDEYREFLHELGKTSSYVGFGKEAENCGGWGMVKECEYGHKLMKRLVCGREWCPTCGEDDSEFHHRRMSRIAPRVFALDSVGYFVFEVRLSQRDVFKTSEALREARRYLHRLLPRQGIKRGVSRWHFYGEARIDEFSGELDFTHYHPHLNILCEAGYVGKKRLKRIRRLWSSWLKNYCGTVAATAPVYYKFHRASAKRWHLVRYITRPTFKKLNDSNRSIASDLFGFNNCSWFGKFTEADKALGRQRIDSWLKTLPQLVRHDVASVAAHDDFNTGLCPVCGTNTRVVEGVQKFDVSLIVHDYGGGLYLIRSP